MNNSTNSVDSYYIGIDAGSVSLNCVVLNQDREIVYEAPYFRHFGRVEEAVLDLFRNIHGKFEIDSIRATAFTGNHGSKISRITGGFYEFETISQVAGAIHVVHDVKSIISMGGQDTALFQIGNSPDNPELEYFNTNGPCASGTGSFIDQQAQRLATSIYDGKSGSSGKDIDTVLSDFIALGLKSVNPSHVACRCTVFTKSDMIHLQNKGERLEDIIYGLHLGNARNYISTIVSNRRLDEPVIFIGGLSLNRIQVRAFKNYFPGIVVPRYNTSIGAVGVALQAIEQGIENRINLKRLEALDGNLAEDLPVTARLELKKTVFSDDNSVTKRIRLKDTPVWLGIDIGSTTTKYAIIDEEREILHKSYVHTQGKPIEVTQNLLKIIQKDIGGKIDIKGVATTGSGRNVVGDFLNADLIIDEITAHARGAVEIDSKIDTIFEIGGQDSKYISISNGYPLDFDMNKVCAAGTGSFLHELANKYGINISEEFQKIALSSQSPVKLAERCTVFMESDMVSYLQRGAEMKDLIGGLCYAIVHNYLNRVVGKRKIGQRIMFLGGPSLNKGVVAAFENVLERGLIVPKHREVLGAYGAALRVKEMTKIKGITRSGFRGFKNAIEDRMEYTEKICHADPNCHNQCKLKIYDFDGRRSIWGGECGRYDVIRTDSRKKENYFKVREAIWEKYMAGVYDTVSDEPVLEVKGRPTIGIQRSLYAFQNSILWVHFFDRLGFQPVLTPPTNSSICEKGIESMTAETCFPIKVSHGHVGTLKGKTRYLFLPVIIDMASTDRSERGFYCPLVQSNQYMTRVALNLERDIIIGPTVHLRRDQKALAMELVDQLSQRLGKKSAEIRGALDYALKMQRSFEDELIEKGKEILQNHDPEESLVVVTGRPYNLHDERLNLRLGQNLAKIGITALPMDFLDLDRVDLSDFPNMYWGLGSRILKAARIIKEHSNFFGIHMTNFSCGADSFLEHFYRHVMGEKPYLILELDEHSAVAGVMTRLEAFKNVIDNVMDTSGITSEEELKLAN